MTNSKVDGFSYNRSEFTIERLKTQDEENLFLWSIRVNTELMALVQANNNLAQRMNCYHCIFKHNMACKGWPI